jgi:hypothetical protein
MTPSEFRRERLGEPGEAPPTLAAPIPKSASV